MLFRSDLNNQGTHQLDVARWALDPKWLNRVRFPTEPYFQTTCLDSCWLAFIVSLSNVQVVYPAAGFASVAKEAGACVIEVNLDQTPQSDLVDIALRGRAKDLVPLLLQAGK